ncbi:MAG: UDP-N-acetylmuramoyl-L-alanine--D-glutamate ligase [Prochloron sp. SP5CPC1]|nr:UDP-N-acetylmuramoyl-L-alanine--D-glutamate ligase [Candidatus Paraprochloron terpiosi SP5CPC1]
MKAYVIGLGRSGIAAGRVLKRDGWEVILSDRASSPTLQETQQELEGEGIAVKLGHTPTLEPTDLPKLIVMSPGVPWDTPFLVAAREQNIDTIGELELAWRYLKSTPWIGITGTNGKTTITALLAAICQTAGLNAPACGNIGHAACELALGEDKLDWIIAEISSYQIESSAQLAPKIGIWTTLTPDHLKRHHTLANYAKIKASLMRRSGEQVFNGDDPYLHSIQEDWPNAYWVSIKGKKELIGSQAKGVYIEDGWVTAFGELILPVALFKMVGEHNRQNLLMAVAAARLAGIEREAIVQAITSFPGVPHRLEYIRTLQGVDYINDSKATNYDAAQVGLAAVKAPTILIAGGEPKEGDDTAWLTTIKEKAAAVLLIGEAAPSFGDRLKESGYQSYEIVETMAKAVVRSRELAKTQDAAVVLLSPACASFDQYRSFEGRGDHFRQLCLEL